MYMQSEGPDGVALDSGKEPYRYRHGSGFAAAFTPATHLQERQTGPTAAAVLHSSLCPCHNCSYLSICRDHRLRR